MDGRMSASANIYNTYSELRAKLLEISADFLLSRVIHVSDVVWRIHSIIWRHFWLSTWRYQAFIIMSYFPADTVRVAASWCILPAVSGPTLILSTYYDDIFVNTRKYPRLFYIIVDTDKTASQILSIMNKNKMNGEVNFLPLNRLSYKETQYPTSNVSLKIIYIHFPVMEKLHHENSWILKLFQNKKLNRNIKFLSSGCYLDGK